MECTLEYLYDIINMTSRENLLDLVNPFSKFARIMETPDLIMTGTRLHDAEAMESVEQTKGFG